jgi:hypothetical protein
MSSAVIAQNTIYAMVCRLPNKVVPWTTQHTPRVHACPGVSIAGHLAKPSVCCVVPLRLHVPCSDFSEDTYRTLAAVDNAVMLVDGAKGIEPMTRKLFAVARLKGLPIFTFVNKVRPCACSRAMSVLLMPVCRCYSCSCMCAHCLRRCQLLPCLAQGAACFVAQPA